MSDDENVTRLADVRRGMSRPRTPDIKNELIHLNPKGELNGIEAGQWPVKAEYFFLPPDCPVTPLGFEDDVFYYVNSRGTLAVLTPNASGRGHIDALFSPFQHYAAWAWPKMTGKGLPAGNYNAELVRQSLFAACAEKGGWNAVEKVRGRGAWLGEDGNLILHLGRKVINGKEEVAPGAIDGYLYPVRPPIDGPDQIELNAAHDLLQFLGSWNWARPELDPELILGWIVAAQLGGALERRPIIYSTGGPGTGKSTLQDLVARVIGKGLVKTSDTTRAGIDQAIKSDSIPVMVDEMEARADTRRATSILELARVAYDGGITLRGGADHQGREFQARSCFWFSSINPPAMEPQDRTRMVFLEAMEFREKTKPPNFDEATLAAIGQTLLWRAVKWWPRFNDLLTAFRDALIEVGHNGRGATTWGILAACSHLARFDDMPDLECLDGWAKQLHPKDLEEFEATIPDWRNCVNHMLTNAPRIFDKRGVNEMTLAGAVLEWHGGRNDLDRLRTQLGLVGMTLVFPKNEAAEFKNAELFVANSHPNLQHIFTGEKWSANAGGMSVWASALRKMPRAYWRQGTARVAGVTQRGMMIKLSQIMSVGDGEVV